MERILFEAQKWQLMHLQISSLERFRSSRRRSINYTFKKFPTNINISKTIGATDFDVSKGFVAQMG